MLNNNSIVAWSSVGTEARDLCMEISFKVDLILFDRRIQSSKLHQLISITAEIGKVVIEEADYDHHNDDDATAKVEVVDVLLMVAKNSDLR